MKKRSIILISFLVVLTVLAYNSLFFVEQRVQSLILQFGEPIRVIKEPGLNIKIPLAQNVVKFDKRILLFDNIGFESSFKLAVLTLTNTSSSGIYGLNEIAFRTLLTNSKIFLIIFMIIGKIELISFFLIIKKFLIKD